MGPASVSFIRNGQFCVWVLGLSVLSGMGSFKYGSWVCQFYQACSVLSMGPGSGFHMRTNQLKAGMVR